ncbi:MAG TPA: SMC family ATPase, partial [Acidimicrobiales bacterium]|nr:SMC family ATPase [Acidimicrobiales bacterium]
MRPTRIEVEGFSAFRARTEVDLADADLFAFVGPTGAGKSSVIDAMVFALYGSVPRYGSDRLVHPVITQGKPECRVQLDFELAGTAYTAVRVVRRTKGGATTKEARLQRGEEVLAADARGVTEAATELLGLDLEQFTKCVVLPQGAFAALLHDTSAKRQDLLVKLLDLGVYEQVAVAARRRVQAADQRLAVLEGQLQQLGSATDDAVAAAEARASATAAVVARLDAATPALTALDDRTRAIDADLAGVVGQLEALEGIAVPADVGSVADAVRQTTEDVTTAEASERAAMVAVEEATALRASLGDPARLREQLRAHTDQAALVERVAKGRSTVADQQAVVAQLDDAAAGSATAEQAAVAALERARLEHAAADLARHLHEGDECPVCGSTVTRLPSVDAGELAAAEAALAAARTSHQQASAAATGARTTLAGYEARLESLTEELTAAEAHLAGAPSADALHEQLAAVDAAEAALATARARDQDARRTATAAREARDRAVAAEGRARAELAAVRDRVAAQGPP